MHLNKTAVCLNNDEAGRLYIIKEKVHERKAEQLIR